MQNLPGPYPLPLFSRQTRLPSPFLKLPLPLLALLRIQHPGLSDSTSVRPLSRNSVDSPPQLTKNSHISIVNPVPIMKLVELIPAIQTSPEVLERAKQFATAMGKTVVTSKDAPGFISNRLLMPYINEAILVLEQGSTLDCPAFKNPRSFRLMLLPTQLRPRRTLTRL